MGVKTESECARWQRTAAENDTILLTDPFADVRPPKTGT